MHEYALCVALLEQVEQLAEQHQAQAVDRILLQVGPLSGAEPELLRHAWPLAAAGSVAEQAELVIESSAIVVRCTQCGARSEVPANRLLCDQCGSFQTRILSGDEMVLCSVELLKGEQEPCA